MTYYEELDVRQDAPVEDIRQAYKTLARLLHPDSQVDPALKPLAQRQMQRLVEIVAVLSDPEKRSLYDETLSQGSRLPTIYRKPVPHSPAPRRWRNSDNAAAEFALRHWSWILSGIVVVGLCTWTLMQGTLALTDSAVDRAALQRHSDAADRDVRPAQKTNAPQRLMNSVVSNASPIIPAAGGPTAVRTAAIAPAETPSAPLLEDLPPTLFRAPELLPEVVRATAPRMPVEGTSKEGLLREAVPPAPNVSSMAGRWLYTPQPRDGSESGMYSATYVELSLVEHAGELVGDYRARYDVPDRAVSPEVTFKIRGAARSATSGKFAWLSSDNAKGEAELALRSPNVLYVSWWTTEFSRHATLGSGTAVLIRLQAP